MLKKAHGEKSICQKEHNAKRAHAIKSLPKIAYPEKSTCQKEHMQKRAHAKKAHAKNKREHAK